MTPEEITNGTNDEAVEIEATDTCHICAGDLGPNHNHECKVCGYDAGASALVVGNDDTENEFYCSRFCIYEDDPNHPLVADVSPERWEVERGKREVQRDMRVLKQRAEKAGVAWT